jgi:hypothetical protein
MPSPKVARFCKHHNLLPPQKGYKKVVIESVKYDIEPSN